MPGAGAEMNNNINESDRVRSVAVGSDHGSYNAKEMLKVYLQNIGYRVVDVGTNNSTEKVDYPDFAVAVCKRVISGDCERGIMLDGAGIGSSAALCWSEKTIKNSREHNYANVLTMGTLQHSSADLCTMARLWLETKFEAGRHWPRINKIMALEREGR